MIIFLHPGYRGIELKADYAPKEAVQQIKDRLYALKFEPKLEESSMYTGRMLAEKNSLTGSPSINSNGAPGKLQCTNTFTASLFI